MFRIRRIYDDVLPVNKEAISQIQTILRQAFNELDSEDIEKLPQQLANPLKFRFRSVLFVADDSNGIVKGFALLHHAPDLKFCYLDFISTASKRTGGGIGSALYEKVREFALHAGDMGLFFECLPDDPNLCRDKTTLLQNAARLKFYERYGAFPIINTAYEAPVSENSDCPPYLVFDDLGVHIPLNKERVREIVKAILERKYKHLCPPEYVKMVVESINENPVRVRQPRYIKSNHVDIPHFSKHELRIALLVNDKHDIHHVHERGYVESPIRINNILKEIEQTQLFEKMKPRIFSEKHILAVHNHGYVRYFKKVCENLPAKKSVYPYVFPIRNAARPPKELSVRAGYYCFDTFTPLNKNAFLAAKRAVDCALSGADCLLKGYRFAYALVRPPGHHAEKDVFGGFCYFNSNAIAADFLSKIGKVAILDLDYHHGNGQQNIFYERNDVLTISIHGHPSFAYPYFSGFVEERGSGDGLGFNVNYALPEKLNGQQYRETLMKAAKKIRKFSPLFLIVALGLDPAKGDPTGTWSLTADDFMKNGELVGSLGLPTLIVQEGGYKVRSLGINARHFFSGLWNGFQDYYGK